MNPVAPDPTDALARAGWDVVGVLPGPGEHRTLVRGADGRTAVVVPVDPDDAALADRCRRLADVRSPHLPRCGPPVALGDGRAGVPVELVDGPDLATLVGARGRLTPGQVVTVAVPVAAALAALHEAGLAHGDVSPTNVVVRRDGRPVLVDLLHGAGEREAGTAAFRAPERADGVVGPAGDVHALARTALAVLAEGGSAAHYLVRRALAGALAPDPAQRPTARALAATLYDALPGAPVLVPPDDVLAGSAVRRLADPAMRTVVRAARPRGRHRRRRRPGPALAVLAAAAVLAGGWVARVGLEATADVRAPSATSSTPAARDVGESPEDAAVRLTRERAAALAARDAAALARVTVPDSAAAAADRRALDGLAGIEVRGDPEVEVTHVRLLEAPDGPGPRSARVLVVARAGVAAAGVDGAAPERRTVLVLEEVDGAWRVGGVEAG